jgi:hydroxypyruvate isomerase
MNCRAPDVPRFAANLSMMFNEQPLPERFAAARAAGFDLVEVLFPYEANGADLRRILGQTEQRMVLINTPPPSYTESPRGFAAVPGGEDRFRHDFKRALRYAEALEVTHLHVMAGVAEGPDARSTMIENLAWAAAHAPAQSLTIEPINPQDMPGDFLNDFALAAEILDAVDAPNLRLQFDAYHAHRITGDVMGTWADHGHRAAHVQVAAAEGRRAPDATGAINYPAFFARLDADGYAGVVAGEYIPHGRTEDSLNWTGH